MSDNELQTPSAVPSGLTEEQAAREQLPEPPQKFTAEQISPLSQREKEHLTYLRILGEFNEAKEKRSNYRRYGTALIIIFGILILSLIFSLDAKIEFLILWIIVILASVTGMIRADYRYHTFKNYLDIADEDDFRKTDDEQEEKTAETDDEEKEEKKI